MIFIMTVHFYRLNAKLSANQRRQSTKMIAVFSNEPKRFSFGR